MSNPQRFTAERVEHPKAADHRWAIIFDATLVNPNGARGFTLRFPILLLTDHVSYPEHVAKQIAFALNTVDQEFET